jgi:hypothetical protein
MIDLSYMPIKNNEETSRKNRPNATRNLKLRSIRNNDEKPNTKEHS